MRTIDADAHVIETPRTFDFLDEAYRKFAPIVVTQTSGPARKNNSGGVHKEHWLIDNTAIPKDKLVDDATPDEARDMTDVARRLKHMDELEIDVQVLYPTMFLRPLTMRPNIALALAKSYNRWLAEIWAKGEGRLRWVAIPPLLTMDKVRDELAWAKDHGACGVFLNSLEFDKQLSNPYFFPLYEAAQELDMPLCLHAGINSFTVHDFFIDDAFSKFKLSILGAFHTLVMNGIPQMFPKARWGFIEVSAQWVPYVLKDLGHRLKRAGKRLPADPLKALNFYVACEVNDDLPMILPYAGEDNLVIGTDYGHSDSSTEIEALRMMKNDGKVPPHVIEKILGDNPKRLYGLSN
jgi:predicted TIM-barrel fold metal-dependent hydrolase